jgi:hypothetical protein
VRDKQEERVNVALACAGGDIEKYSVRNKDGDQLAPGTYFVIKATDLFATAGLWAYIHTLETVLELAAQRPVVSEPEEANLRAMTDRAIQLAKTWQSNGLGRLPD